MSSFSVEEAQTNLSKLIHQLKPGDEMVITEGDHPIAILVVPAASFRKPRLPGSAKGKLTILSRDNEHLEDFREYME